MTCKDPNCLSCSYDRRYPNDLQRALVFDLSNVFKEAISAMVAAHAVLRDNPMIGQNAFNDVLNLAWTNQIQNSQYDQSGLLHVTAALVALVDPALVTRALSIEEQYITEAAMKEGLPPTDTKAAVDQVRLYIDNLRKAGLNLLSGTSVTDPHYTGVRQ